jgi:hypothetical protein
LREVPERAGRRAANKPDAMAVIPLCFDPGRGSIPG